MTSSNNQVETRRIIDIRSDTVTQPTDAMREAMSRALVGDDVYGDDYTTIDLEKLGARIFGKEAALFVPSGTFGNQLALMTHCKRGDEVIVGEDAHIVVHEVGGAAVLAGVQLRMLPTQRGVIALNDIKKAIRGKDIHYPDTSLICMENAHGCGAVLPLDYMSSVYELAKEHSIPVHLDGARVFNAATALRVPVAEIGKYCDTINVCLSKGLCAPIGSLLVGDSDFIEKARKFRKLMGGGMRQTGILAAAGHIALEEMTLRLAEDHSRAQQLAQRLDAFQEIEVLWEYRDINMVFFKLSETVISEGDFVLGLEAKGIKINGMEDGIYRFVTHYWIDDADLIEIENGVKQLLRKGD